MVGKIREWVSSLFAGLRPQTEAQVRATDQNVRQKRADMVAGLHADVSRLQQEILQLSNAAGPGGEGGDGPNDARIADLAKDLSAKQRELAKYQGRI